jgi:uncharacterized circularly permuted ATP-grasp superfamily protein
MLFRRAFLNFTGPLIIYVHICGRHLFRDDGGNYLVLVDNVGCPSGSS